MPLAIQNNFKKLLIAKFGKGNVPSQDMLAKELGMSQTTVSRWFQGKVNRYDEEVLLKLCEFLDCQVSDLLQIVKIDNIT